MQELKIPKRRSGCGVVASVLTEAEAEKAEVDRWQNVTDDRFWAARCILLWGCDAPSRAMTWARCTWVRISESSSASDWQQKEEEQNKSVSPGGRWFHFRDTQSSGGEKENDKEQQAERQKRQKMVADGWGTTVMNSVAYIAGHLLIPHPQILVHLLCNIWPSHPESKINKISNRKTINLLTKNCQHPNFHNKMTAKASILHKHIAQVAMLRKEAIESWNETGTSGFCWRSKRNRVKVPLTRVTQQWGIYSQGTALLISRAHFIILNKRVK